MNKKPFAVYADTSVIGGCLDEEFSVESRALLDMARQGEIELMVSDLLTEELAGAPEEVRQILAQLPRGCVAELVQCDESRYLRDAYLEANVVSQQSFDDAHHVALATVAKADVIVSWNFKHIVHFEKIRLFNAVNLREGYAMIDIRSPKEMV